MNSVTLMLLFACGSPALKSAEEPTTPLLLEVDPNMAAIQPLPDRSELAKVVEPWDNFHTHDTLNDKHDIRVQPPRMMLVAQRDRYEKDPVGGILRDGKINFWPLRNDASGVNGCMACIIVVFNVIHPNGCCDTRMLVEIANVGRKARIVDNAL